MLLSAVLIIYLHMCSDDVVQCIYGHEMAMHGQSDCYCASVRMLMYNRYVFRISDSIVYAMGQWGHWMPDTTML